MIYASRLAFLVSSYFHFFIALLWFIVFCAFILYALLRLFKSKLIIENISIHCYE